MKNQVSHLSSFLLFIFLFSGCSPKSSQVAQVDPSYNGNNSQTEPRLWKDVEKVPSGPTCPGKILPVSYRLLEADTSQMRKTLLIHGEKPGVVSSDTVAVAIPLPDGTWETFEVTQVQVMAPELAAKYPYLKTFSGKSKIYPADQIRLEIYPGGVRGMILSTRGSIVLDPFCETDKLLMISYYKKNLPEGTKEEFERK